MQNIEWLKIKEIFHRTLDLPKPEREKFLENQDESLRLEVRRLLDSHEKLEDFIAEPIAREIGFDANFYIGKKIGKYKILSLLGAGGMGQVFLAEKEGLDKKFALKIIKRGMDTDSILKRFLRERQILSRLENPYIASLLDAGSTENGLPFFVMQFVDGEPITKFCDKHQFDTGERLKIFRKVCEAVKYAHQNLIIHRDIKPSNILVTNDGTPKLLDFGIAKLLNSDEFEYTTTAMQSRMLTPEYASPEQISGQPITTATDVYSLGVVLYELLTGARPFQTKSKNYQEIADAVLTEEPVRPSSIVSRPLQFGENFTDEYKGQRTKNKGQRTKLLKGDLDNIILKSLRKEPERRYQSVTEFSEDIRRYLVGLPVTATADSAVYRFSKFVRRNKIGTLVAFLILLLSGFSIWQGIAANRERQKAERRFNETRELASLVIFEYDEKIKSLSGTTEIREKIVRDTLEYLDRLTQDSENSPDLQRKLALAYQKIGSIQGDGDYLSNLGKTKDALESFRKAVSIQEKVAAGNSATLKDRQKLASFNLSLALQYGVLGDWENQRKLNLENLPVLQETANLAPENAEAQADLAKVYRSIGNMASHGNGTMPEAVENFRKALAIYEKIVPANPQRYNRLKTITEKNLGSALQLNNNLDEAIVFYRRAFESDFALVSAEPNNVAAKIDLSFSYRALGSAFEEQGNLKNALQNYQKALQIRLEVLAADPTDSFTRNAIGRSYNHVGETLTKLKRYKEAEENFQKALEIFSAENRADPNNANKKTYLARVLANLGDTYLAMSKLSGNFKNQNLKQAENNYLESLRIFATLQNSLSESDRKKQEEITFVLKRISSL